MTSTAAQSSGDPHPGSGEGYSGAPRATVETFDPSVMQAVGARPPLRRYIRDLWGSRHFIMYDAHVRLAVSQDHTFLGKAWIVLNPVLMGLTFYVIFGLLLDTGRGIDNFVAFIVLGLTMFMYSSRSVVTLSRSMISGKALVRGFMFPRAALTLSIVARDALTQFYAIISILFFLLLVPPLEPVSWTWLLLVPVFLLQTVFNWGLGMLLAPAVYKIPDLANMLSFVMRLWMYSSGIFYDPSRFVSDPRILALFHFNPLYQVLSMSRDLVLRAQVPSLSSWAVLTCSAVLMLVVGFLVFWFNEESYADER
ncbi:ABC transporter permease [Kocuria rhizophila]|uniref:ABC transporter permease n=1 Tax=Kocuria rhizophila TaxID=72000 RepID=UPI0021A587F6|nr:ABC transporter permease [Kocuria rhizophila]MCT1880393.1 ABC transporter permease [Kocuria rhizophila]